MPTRTQNAMTGAAVTATLLLTGLTSTAQAQDAVQWRVEDGGNGHWYQFIYLQAGCEEEGTAAAAALGAHLATATSEPENLFMDSLIEGNGAFIGGFQIIGTVDDNENWYWVTGELWDYTAWAPSGQPSGGLNEDCVYMYSLTNTSSGSWHDNTLAPCDASSTTERAYIIEWSADCNEDGIVDYGQILDGTLLDVNDNGVPDVCEAIQWRVEDGGNGHWYLRTETPEYLAYSWEEAQQVAERSSGYLVCIESADEQAWIQQNLPTARNGSFFIGLSQDPGGAEPDGGWGWVNGSPLDYTNWNGSEPNDSNGGEDYAIAFKDTQVWVDVVGEANTPVLVEYSSDYNNDGIVDFGQILDGTLIDADNNGIPDDFQIDDNNNGIDDRFEDALVVPDDFPTIQEAINNAPVNSIVRVRAGTYEENLNYAHTVLLRSIDGPEVTIIDGSDSGTVVTITGPSGEPSGIRQVIDGFTIQNGRFNGVGGGGLLVSQGTVLTLRNSIVRDNIHEGSEYGGGGIRVENSTLHAIDCVFSGNQTNWNGAAIYFWASCCNTLERCLFQNEGSGDRFEYPPLDIVHLQQGASASLTACTFDQCEIQDSELVLWVGCTASVTDTTFLDALKPQDDLSGSIASGTGSTLTTENIRVCGHPEPYFDGITHSDLGGSVFSTAACDCNQDGLFDYDQLLDGSLSDDNQDGVPDFCEYVQWRVEDGGNGHWYHVTELPENCFDEIRSVAQSRGGDLVSITSEEENDVVLAAVNAVSFETDRWIIGLTVPPGVSEDDPANWFWIDGSTETYRNWSTSTLEPEDYPGTLYEPLASFESSLGGRWADVPCGGDNEFAAIIEWSADCNNDGIVDFGQILNGTLVDCNGNGIPDSCELNDTLSLSVDRTPESPTDFIEFDVSAMSEADDEVSMTLSVVGELAATSEFMYVYLDDLLLGLAFSADGLDCEEVRRDFIITASEWNDAGLDGARSIRVAGLGINPDACTQPRTSINVTVPLATPDCDANGIWDACEADGDSDGTIDACDDCPSDPGKTDPGTCGCGIADTDTDDDGTPDCIDLCPQWPGDCSEDGQTLFVVEGQSIQEALPFVPAGGTLSIGPGTYTGTGDSVITLSGNGISIIGSDGAEATIIDGENARRGLTGNGCGDDGTVIQGLTFTNGYSSTGGGIHLDGCSPLIVDCVLSGNVTDQGGGGMYCNISDPVLENCLFENNRSDNYYGGGMINYTSSPTLTDCIFDGNTANSGDAGGMYNFQGSDAVLTNCLFIDNQAGGGGGMRNNDSSPTLTNCRFEGNTATIDGGGMYNDFQSAPTLDGCEFISNSAGNDGGGMVFFMDSQLNATDCTFESNTAADYGGGIYLESSAMELLDCQFISNTSAYGAGMAQGDSNTSSTLTNCLFDGNQTIGGDADGGGFYAAVCGGGLNEARFFDSVFTNNSSEWRGGGLSVHCLADVRLEGCTVSGNSASGPGGGIVNPGSPLALLDTAVCGNSSDQINGGFTDLGGNCIVSVCDSDLDGTLDCADGCPDDPDKIEPGACGCGIADTDTDGDSIPDCIDPCPDWAYDCSEDGSVYQVPAGASLETALTLVPAGGTLELGAGSFELTASLDPGGKAVTIQGALNEDGSLATTIDARGNGSVMVFQSGEEPDTEVRNLILTGGSATYGGGIECSNTSSPAIVGCLITGNVATDYGGGVNCYLNCAPLIQNCTITGNSAGLGGGGISVDQSEAKINACVIQQNDAPAGGALYCVASPNTELSGSILCGNTVDQTNGDCFDYGDNCILEDCGDDLDGNGVPDGCDPDCDGDGEPDAWEIESGQDLDCDLNGVPDACDVANGFVEDCDENGIPDSCDIAEGAEDDNENGLLDECELAAGDLDLDGCVTGADLAILLGLWGLPNPPVGDLNGDGTIDGMDLATLLANWGCE